MIHIHIYGQRPVSIYIYINLKGVDLMMLLWLDVIMTKAIMGTPIYSLSLYKELIESPWIFFNRHISINGALVDVCDFQVIAIYYGESFFCWDDFLGKVNRPTLTTSLGESMHSTWRSLQHQGWWTFWPKWLMLLRRALNCPGAKCSLCWCTVLKQGVRSLLAVKQLEYTNIKLRLICIWRGWCLKDIFTSSLIPLQNPPLKAGVFIGDGCCKGMNRWNGKFIGHLS